ncbi:MAG: hypothetical protein ACE5Q6_08280 [Dehalococcoidia bacterium]
MWSTRKRYLISIIGMLVGLVAVACGAAATPTTLPTPTLAPPPATSAPEPTATPVPPPPTATAAIPEAAVDASATAATGFSFTWEIEEVDSGTKPALALTTDDVPHVAYMLEAQQGFVKDAVRNGESWDLTTVAEGYFYGPLDLAIGSDNVAHISYHDHQASSFQPDKGDAIYAALQDGQWEVNSVFHPGHDGWDNRIAVDSQDRPHISAIDPLEFGGDGLEYYGRNDSGNWVVEEVGTGPITYKYATSIAVDPQGAPHISYFDQRGNDLALASRGADGWDISTIDADGDTGLFSFLIIDEEGRFHISYFQRNNPSSGVIKYATRGPGDTAWEIREVDRLSRLTFGFVGARNITSLALDSDGNPWIAYSDEKKLKLAVWDGAKWGIQTVVDAESKTLGQLVSMKLDSQDQPHIAYFEVTSPGPLEGLVKYAKGTP